MKHILRTLAVVVSVLFVFCGGSDAGIRENIIMSKVPKKFKSWTNESPGTTFKISQPGGYDEEPYSAVIKLDEFSYIVMEGIHVPGKKLSNGNKRKAYDVVRFGWKIKVTNTTNKKCKFNLHIPFYDSEGFEIDDAALYYSQQSYELNAGESKTFQDDSRISLDSIKKVNRIDYVLKESSRY